MLGVRSVRGGGGGRVFSTSRLTGGARAITRCAVLAGVLAMATAGRAAAQARASAAEETPVDAASDDAELLALANLSLEDLLNVSVSTQRREEQLHRVPISVTVVTGDELERLGMTDASRLDLITPGFVFGRSGSDARPAIRGVPTRQISGNGDPVNGFFVDGVYQTRPAHALMPFVDLERVEVQKGPQGTFFGRNTLGGNIALLSREPEEGTEAEVHAQGGNYAHRRLVGVVNAPLGNDLVRLRAAFMGELHNGYVENIHGPGNDAMDERQLYFRGGAKILPAKGLTALLRVHYWHQGGAGAGLWGHKILGTLRDPATGERSLYGEIDRENPRAPLTLDGEAREPNPRSPYEVSADTPFGRRLRHLLSTLEIRYDMGPVQMTSLTASSDFRLKRSADSDFTEFAVSEESQLNDSSSFTQEVHLSSTESFSERYAVEWIAGGFFLDETLHEVWRWDYLPTPGTSFQGNFRARFRSWAGFGQASYSVLPALRLTLGGRYTHDVHDLKTVNDPDWSGDVVVRERRVRFPALTWNVGADYTVGTSHFVYATARTGHKTGGTNGNMSYPTFDAEHALAFELGGRARYLGGRLSLHLSLYHNRYSKFQVQNFDTSTRVTYFSNAGRASATGTELELQWRPSAATRVRLAGGYMRAIFDSLPENPTAFEQQVNAGELTIDLSGKAINLSPTWTASIDGSHEFSLGQMGYLTPSALVAFVDEYATTRYGTPLDRQKAYTATDLRLTWETLDRRLYIAAYVRNLEDNAVLQTSSWGGSNALFANYGAPRVFGLSAGVTDH